MLTGSEPIFIEGRRVYVVTGSATQTINICTETNERGVYAAVFRTNRRLAHENIASFASLTELADWLLEIGAAAEGLSPREQDAAIRDAVQELDDLRQRYIHSNADGAANATDVPGNLQALLSYIDDLDDLVAGTRSMARVLRTDLHERLALVETAVTREREARFALDQRLAGVCERLASLGHENATQQQAEPDPFIADRVSTPEAASSDAAWNVAHVRGEYADGIRHAWCGTSKRLLAPLPADARSKDPPARKIQPLEPDPLNGLNWGAVVALMRDIDEESERFVVLSDAVSFNALRSALPSTHAIQPRDDGADVAVVLIYRTRTAAPAEPASRLAYLLVDLSALLAPSGLLDARTQERLEKLLHRPVFVAGPMIEHVIARIHWRRTEPVHGKDIRVPERSGARKAAIPQLLCEVAAGRPELAHRLTLILKILGSPPVRRNVPQLVDDAARPPADEPSVNLDALRLVEARAAAHLAQQLLVSLDESGGDLSGPSADTKMTNTAVVDITLPSPVLELAVRLSEGDCHTLPVVRAIAANLGLAPLDAVRLINEWAERRAGATGKSLHTVIEVDDHDDAVFVDQELKQLLA